MRNIPAMIFSLVLLGWSTFAHAEPRIQVPHPIAHDSWITDADSPPDGTSGTVSLKLLVSNSGAPTSCEITKSSGSTILDDFTCQLLVKRAKFTPASVNGKPADGSYFDTVHWLNASEGVPFTVAERTAVVQFDIDAHGKIENCSVDGARTTEEKTFCHFYDRVAVPTGEPYIRSAHVRQTTRVEITPR